MKRAATLAVLLMPCALHAQGISYSVRVGATGGGGEGRGGARTFHVRAEFPVPAGRDTLLVSLPVWTPGSYDLMDFARYVHDFTATSPDGRALFWDKNTPSTWRIATAGASRVTVQFETNPDSVALELSRIGADFAYFNGANLFPYPDGAGFDFPADVRIETPPGWRVATGLTPAGAPGAFRAASYHDLVDCPTFLGNFAFDSVQVDGRTIRFAIYPDSALTPVLWDTVAQALRRIAATENQLMGGPPYDRYTFLVYAPAAQMAWAGGLEHSSSQLDAISMDFFARDRRRGTLGDFTLPLFAHEFFHLWNVKRIRPAAMWPYDYGREQPTPLLWWSEGVTDYFADVALARSGLWTGDAFVSSMNDNVQQVEGASEIVSAEDASVDTWIHPTWVDEAQYYYPKGSLLGLMLDIGIRRSTRNGKSLDDVMRALLTDFWRQGRGFTTDDLLGIIRRWCPGVDDFYRRFIRGREPLPYDSVLPQGGIAVAQRQVQTPVVGVEAEEFQAGGTRVTAVVPGSLADQVGIEPGDILVTVGEVPTNGAMWPTLFRATYANAAGWPIKVTFRRGAQLLTGSGTVQVRTAKTVLLRRDPNASPEARAVFEGITGR